MKTTQKNSIVKFILLMSLLLAISISGCAPVAAEAVPAADVAEAETMVLEELPLEVSVGGVAELRDSGAFMLDVREPDEWSAGHIPGATLIPLGELESRLAELPDDQPIVVYCRTGNRSAEGRDTVLSAGFTSVTSMAGGFSAWAQAGYDTEKGE